MKYSHSSSFIISGIFLLRLVSTFCDRRLYITLKIGYPWLKNYSKIWKKSKPLWINFKYFFSKSIINKTSGMLFFLICILHKIIYHQRKKITKIVVLCIMNFQIKINFYKYYHYMYSRLGGKKKINTHIPIHCESFLSFHISRQVGML